MQQIMKQVIVVYDGDCPICHRLITATRLKASGIELQLINARECDVYKIPWFPKGVSIHKDMVIKVGEHIFYGGEGLHTLSLMASRSNWLNKITYTLFSIKPIALILYPVLRWSRMLLLRIIGVKALK